MRREILFALFILLMIFVYTEAKAIAEKNVLTVCSEDTLSPDECIPAEKPDNITQITGIVERVQCIEDTKEFQRFQIHLVPQVPSLGAKLTETPRDIMFTLLKNDIKKDLKKSVYFIKGETPTLWLRKKESSWKIAQVRWFAKDVKNHLEGPPSCNL